MRVILSTLIPVLNDFDPTGALVVLAAFYPKGTSDNEVYYFTTNVADVVYPSSGDSHTYQPIPMQFDPEEENGDGEISSARLLIGNVGNVWTKKARDYRGFPSGRVIVRMVNTAFLSDVTSELSQTFKIERYSIDYDQDVISFDLKNWSLYKANVPRERLFRTCQLSYANDGTGRCGYSGALSTCDHTLRGPNGCEYHANAARYGGAPGLVKQ